MVRFCAVGDPHGEMKKIRKVARDVDFYLVTGDLGKADLARKILFRNIEREKKGLDPIENDLKTNKKIHDEIHYSTLEVMRYLAKFAPVYSIQGNVGIFTLKEARERTVEEGFKHIATRKIIDEDPNMHIVKNVIRVLGGVRVGFLEHFAEANSVRTASLEDKKLLKKIKKEMKKAEGVLERFGHVDILICHAPPYGYLDQLSGEWGAPKDSWGKHVGSKVILNYIKKFQPRYVFCGHIHEGEGKAKIGETEVFNLGVGSSKVVEF